MVRVRFHGDVVTESLIGLAVASAGETPDWADDLPDEIAAAVSSAGDRTGEVWLHLLGLALELGETAWPDAFVDAVDELEPVALMRHVLGVYVPAWRACVDRETIEGAAAGDPDCALTLLASGRYYGGRAADALPTLLQLGPGGAKARILDVLRHWVDAVVLPRRDRLEHLHADVDRDLPDGEAPLATVERITGLRFEPEAYTDEVVLVPQFARRGGQVLAQHAAARIIAYDAAWSQRPPLESLAEVFAALGEVSRLEILRHLAIEPCGTSDLARGTGLAKSTTHQHLTTLRRAGLVTLAGQAWRYRFEVRPERVASVADELIALLQEESS